MTEQHAFEPRLVLVTVPEMEVGKRLARECVESKYAACVNLIPKVESIFWWEGRVQEGSEVLMVIKTSAASLESLERCVQESHPYEIPEFVVLSSLDGAESYLNWWKTSLV